MSSPAHQASPVSPQADWSTEDRVVLQQVDKCLSQGKQILRWWQEADRTDGYTQRFDTVCTFNRPDQSFAFFGQAPVDGRSLPVMGDVMDLFYDRPKSPDDDAGRAALWMRDQVREFALRYFMRISDFRPPQAAVASARPTPQPWLRPFTFCPEKFDVQEGFGYSQLYYKRRSDGQIGKFPEEDRFAIFDVRELGEKYEWVVLKIRIFDFNLALQPWGPGYPGCQVPLNERQWVVISRDFVSELKAPEEGVLGKYGFGYAVLRNPAARGILAYGPGRFDAGFQLFNFRVLESGEARVRLVFAVNRPERLVNLSLDPADWTYGMMNFVSGGMASRLLGPLPSWNPALGSGVDPILGAISLLNWITGNQAAKQLCISREDLEKQMLVQHFMQNYQLITGSLLTWRQIPDWLDRSALPDWVVKGRS